MANRTGTYVAFHADGTSDPAESDMKYYQILNAWKENDDIEFTYINSHDKTAAVRDSSKRSTLEARLKERLNASKNMLLIVGDTTKNDTDWVPFEIRYAVDQCKIPLIVAYTGYKSVLNPSSHENEWPAALKARIENGTAMVIHVPFRKEPIKDAISQFTHNNPPGGSLVHYTKEAQQHWGLIE